MILLQLLPLLATTVALAAGQLCPESPFTDITGESRQDCVNGNFHVYCRNDAPLTVYMEESSPQFDDLVSIDGVWFGLKCGANAILLDATPSLSCPPPPCGDHSCSFVNPGGVEPQTSCTGENTVKSCIESNLFIGNDEYTNAACSSNGTWVAWTCDGDVHVVEGALQAACSRTQCVDPIWLEPQDLTAANVFSEFAVDMTQRSTTSSEGKTTFSCKLPTILAGSMDDNGLSMDGQAFQTGPLIIQCSAVEGKWFMVDSMGEKYDWTLRNMGCVKPGCSASQLLDGTETGLSSLASELVITTLEIVDQLTYFFGLICPTGSALAYLDGTNLVWTPAITTITCAESGWFGSNLTNRGLALGEFKYGCFAPKCSNSLTYMTESQVSSIVGVTVDVNQKATFVDGAFQLKCSLDAQIATITGTTLTVQNWWLGCGESVWMVKEEGKADVAYANLAVGCIKPTCTGMLLFDGTEAVLATKPSYEFIATQPSFANNKWELVCPSDCTIGYAETPSLLLFDVSMKVTCDAAGWWVRTSTNAAGSALTPKKIGCFKKIVAPTVPTPETCPELSYLVQANFTSYVGVTVTEQTAVLSNGESKLKCLVGSSFAYLSSSLFVDFSWLTCAGAASGGWRLKSAEGANAAFIAAPVACIKPTCTGLTLFAGTESLLSENPLYEFVSTQASWQSSAGRFGLVCPFGTGIGYDDGGTFVYDSTVSITCEATGWLLKSSTNTAGIALVTRKYGCFQKLPNCPMPVFITPAQLSSYVGVSVDVTQNVTSYTGGYNTLKCPIKGTYLATFSSSSLQIVPWFLDCHNDQSNGWRMVDAAGGNSKFKETTAVACIKATCTGMTFFGGTENVLRSYPQYLFVEAAPSFNNDKFELVCPAETVISYQYNVSTIIFDASLKVTCESAGWWMKSSSNANGVAISTERYGCFRPQYVPSTRCPAPLLLNQTLVSNWTGISVDTEQTKALLVPGPPPFIQVKCSGNSLFAYLTALTGGALTRQEWFITCDEAVTAGWRVKNGGAKNDPYRNVAVGCVKPTCTGLQVFAGTEFVLSSYSNYTVVAPVPTMVTNGKFTYTCPAGSTFGYASSATEITVQTGISLTCETSGWWMRTTANTAGSALAARIGCFKTVTPPVLPAQCQTGINYFVGNEKVLRDNSDYACTGDKAKAVNGQWKLVCPEGTAIGYAESSTKFAYSPSMQITCGATGWTATTLDNPTGVSLSSWKVGCFKKINTTACPTTALHLFTGTETLVTTSALYTFTGDALMYKDGKAELVCSADAAIAYSESTELTYDATMKITCEATGWTVKTSTNTAGTALAAWKVGCFRPKFVPTANCKALPFLTQSDVADYVGVTVDTAAAIVTISGVNTLRCPEGSIFAYFGDDDWLWSFNWYLTCSNSGTDKWRIQKPDGSNASYSDRVIGCIKPSCSPLAFFDGTEPALLANQSYQLVKTVPTYPFDKFELACPVDSQIGYLTGDSTFEIWSMVRITCEKSGWTATHPVMPTTLVGAVQKIGCFKKVFTPTTQCPALSFITQSMANSFVGVTVEPTTVFPETFGPYTFGCRPDSQFAYISTVDGSLVGDNGLMQCASSLSPSWIIALFAETTSSPAYTGQVVGCVKPTCLGMRLYDGSEQVWDYAPMYRHFPTAPSYKNGRFELACPSGCGIAYQTKYTLFDFSSDFKVTCESGGWTMKTPSNPAGSVIKEGKFGCFQLGATFTSSPNCPEIPLLTQALVSSFVGITVDEIEFGLLSFDTESEFKCRKGTRIAYLSAGVLMGFDDQWVTCDSTATNGWRVTDALEADLAFTSTSIGCVRPTCTNWLPFEGTEAILSTISYKFVDIQPSIKDGQFQFICPGNHFIGYVLNEELVIDETMTVKCTEGGWWVSSDLNGEGILGESMPLGCFKKKSTGSGDCEGSDECDESGESD